MGLQDRDYVRQIAQTVYGMSFSRILLRSPQMVFLYLASFYFFMGYLFMNLPQDSKEIESWLLICVGLLPLYYLHNEFVKKQALLLASVIFFSFFVLITKFFVILLHFWVLERGCPTILFMLAGFFLITFLVASTRIIQEFSYSLGWITLLVNCLWSFVIYFSFQPEMSIMRGMLDVIMASSLFSYHYFFIILPLYRVKGILVVRGGSWIKAQKIIVQALFFYPLWSYLFKNKKRNIHFSNH